MVCLPGLAFGSHSLPFHGFPVDKEMFCKTEKYAVLHILLIISLFLRENMSPQLTLLPMCGFIAQLVEHRTGIVEAMGLNPAEALNFFRLLKFPITKIGKFTVKIILTDIHIRSSHMNYFINCT